MKCQEIFHKGKPAHKCKRQLFIADERCIIAACEAEYEEWTPWAPCSGECIERLTLDDGSLLKKRSRNCQSELSLCKKEGGEDEYKFCDGLTLCPLQERDPDTGSDLGTYHFFKKRKEIVLFIYFLFFAVKDYCPDVIVNWLKNEDNTIGPTISAEISLAPAEVIHFVHLYHQLLTSNSRQ